MKTLLLLPLLLLTTSLLHAQDVVLAKLEASPRHHEWVDIPHGDRSTKAFVAYPEISENALTVIVIHENRGLTDWVRGFADDLAAAGHIAIAPDFLSGFSAEFTRTSDFTNPAEASQALYQVAPDRITAPVYGFYAQNDQRINAGIATVGVAMERLMHLLGTM